MRSRTAGWVLACVVVALTLTGCTRAPAAEGTGTLPVGSSQQEVRVAGADRTFEVYRPASLPPGPVPLVVMLHGGFGSGSQAESS